MQDHPCSRGAGGPRQFQESLPFTNPGRHVNDVVERDFCTAAAGEDRPAYNPALVLLGRGTSDAVLTIDGEGIARVPSSRVGLRHRLEDSDLIVWIRHEGTEPFEMTLTPASK